MSDQKPRIGIGVIIQNPDGKILVAKRKGSHAPYYSIPGGHLETGETFEECAIREVKEEHGITIKLPKVIAVANNLETYRNEGLHYISIILLAGSFSGKPMINEPDKCEEILWVDPTDLPQPHFDASSLGVKCFLENKFYVDETS
jgi:8-oxo-dGTP diphosphatase